MRPQRKTPAASGARGLDDDRSAHQQTIVIVVEPVGHRGCFLARLDERVIVAASSTPFFDAARILIARGYDPGVVLEMRRVGSTAFDLRGPLRVAARLDVKDAKFVKHRPHPDGHGKADASLVDATEAPGPNPALRPRSTRSRLAASGRPALAGKLDRVAATLALEYECGEGRQTEPHRKPRDHPHRRSRP
jgi:hypothetical protein